MAKLGFDLAIPGSAVRRAVGFTIEPDYSDLVVGGRKGLSCSKLQNLRKKKKKKKMSVGLEMNDGLPIYTAWTLLPKYFGLSTYNRMDICLD